MPCKLTNSLMIAVVTMVSCHAADKDSGIPSKFCIDEHVSIDDPAISCVTKDKYKFARLDDTDKQYKISHAVKDTQQGKKETFTARLRRDDSHTGWGWTEDISPEAFTKGSQTPNALHSSKERYYANLVGGGYVKTYRGQGVVPIEFESQCVYPGKPFRKDLDGGATFRVVQSAYAQQAAFRKAQAAKSEENKKD